MARNIFKNLKLIVVLSKYVCASVDLLYSVHYSYNLGTGSGVVWTEGTVLISTHKPAVCRFCYNVIKRMRLGNVRKCFNGIQCLYFAGIDRKLNELSSRYGLIGVKCTTVSRKKSFLLKASNVLPCP